MIEASRDHGKSFAMSYAWPLYHIQRITNPKKAEHIAIVSYAEDQARKPIQRIRKAIEQIPSLQWLIPKSKAYVWEASQLNTSNDCTVEAFGFGSSIRGGHYHRVIVDDPAKKQMSMNLAEQEDFFYGSIMPAVRRDGQIVITGNPVDTKDLLLNLEANKEFETFFYPAIDSKGQALWSDQWPIDALEAKKRSLPAHIWAREYMLKRVAAADTVFKAAWIRYYDPFDIYKKNLYRVMTIDPAISPGGDALAAVVTGTDEDENTYVLERFSHHGDLEAGIGRICDLISSSQPHRIGFENFAFQKMYKIWLEKEMRKRNLQFFVEETGRDSKKTKSARIQSLQPKLAQGKLFFRRDHSMMVDQLLLWDPVSKTNEDDEIDALSWQVPMWRKPTAGWIPPPPPVRAGSMGEAIQQLGKIQSTHWLSKMFEDFNA